MSRFESMLLISIFRLDLSFLFLPVSCCVSPSAGTQQKRDGANEVPVFEVSLKRLRAWHGARFIAGDGWFSYSLLPSFLFSLFSSFFFFNNRQTKRKRNTHAAKLHTCILKTRRGNNFPARLSLSLSLSLFYFWFDR